MKHSFIMTALCLGVALSGCQESREQVAKPLSESELYKAIGEEIPFETAMEWMELHRKQASQSARTEDVSEYLVPAAQMKELLSSVEDLTGVAFHYGLDENDQQHIILIPVASSLSLWEETLNRIIIDANTGMPMDATTARSWATKYENANPSGIWFHFFGKYIFDEMCALPYFTSVDIEPATNSLDLTSELLLLVWQDDVSTSGRGQAEDATVYDASNACPPCAVE